MNHDEFMELLASHPEATRRSALVPPPGAAKWLAQVMLSAGREFGSGPYAKARLIGVLLARIDDADADEVRRLFNSFEGSSNGKRSD